MVIVHIRVVPRMALFTILFLFGCFLLRKLVILNGQFKRKQMQSMEKNVSIFFFITKAKAVTIIG